MRRIGSVFFICALWTVSAHGAEHCGKPSTAGIKRCEQIVTSKVDPTTNWETITYIDSNKEIVDLSITFSRKLGEPIYVDALVGGLQMKMRTRRTRSWLGETTSLALLYACPDGVARRGFK